MTTKRAKSASGIRRAMTLIEVMVTIVILALVGTAFTRLVTSQLRFADSQIAAKDAREVSRSAINALSTDVRMVDADSGVIAAAVDSFTVLAPYAEGMVCGAAASGGGTVISLIPHDSSAYAEGGYAGYAYIDTTTTGSRYEEVYQYAFSSTLPVQLDSAAAASSVPCVTNTNRVGVFGSGAVTVQPGMPARAQYHAAILVRKVTYAFRPSGSIPWSRGLFRRVVGGTRGDEEIMAPFDSTAAFYYFLADGTRTAAASGPALNKIRGIELRLNGLSERLVPGSLNRQSAPLTTAIFFKNRPLR